MNIWTFCFSSKNVQLICSRDVNQKYKIFYWFPVHLFYMGHGNSKFSYIYTIEIRKYLLWKFSRWNARLIYTINKNNKNNNKTTTGQPKLLKNFPFKRKLLNYWCPSIAILGKNYYNTPSRLLIVAVTEITSRERTQSDPVSMAIHGIWVTPLINMLTEIPWYEYSINVNVMTYVDGFSAAWNQRFSYIISLLKFTKSKKIVKCSGSFWSDIWL